MLFLVLRNKHYRGTKRESIFMLVLWFIIIFAICHKGVRLIVFLLIPMGIALGWGCEEALAYCRRRGGKRKIMLPVWGIAVLFMVGTLFFNAKRTANALFPMIDDEWYILLNNVKQNTPADAVLNSWWDFGDWFKTVAGRRVIFDGQSQNSPQGYWMAKALLSNSEEESVAILKMLNSSGNKVYDLINKYLNDPFKSVILLEKVLYAQPDQVKDLLLQVLPEDKASEVMVLLSAKPASAYFVVDYTMIGKMFPISYLGNWDFSRVYMIKNINKQPKEKILSYLIELGMDAKSADAMYRDAQLLSPEQYDGWISRHRRFISGILEGKVQGDVVLFNNGLVFNPKDNTMFVFNGYNGQYGVPKSIFYMDNGKLVEHVYPDSTMDFSVLLLHENGSYKAIELDRELGASLFTKLYFLKGKGLANFKPFAANRDERNYIGVFEIDWNIR